MLDEHNVFGPDGPRHAELHAVLNMSEENRALLMLAVSAVRTRLSEQDTCYGLAAVTTIIASSIGLTPLEFLSLMTMTMSYFYDPDAIHSIARVVEEAAADTTLSTDELYRMFNNGDAQ